jgi:DNA-binding transcriptional LysR family regulator
LPAVATPMLNLTHARTFLSVLEHRGFRRAARSLGLSSSTIVDHIDRLEVDLGARLLVRQRGKVQPTPDGARLAPLARALVETAARARELLSGSTLRVAAASNVGVFLLPPPIASFAVASGVAVEPWIGTNPEVLQRLQDGMADVAAVEWWDDRPGFEATVWRRERLLVIVAPDHPWAARGSVTPAELGGEIILGGETGSGTGTVLRQALGALADGLNVRSGYGSTEAVKRAVRAGHGISIVLAASVVDELQSGRLRAVELTRTAVEKRISLVVPKGVPSTSAAMAFVRHVVGEGQVESIAPPALGVSAKI